MMARTDRIASIENAVSQPIRIAKISGEDEAVKALVATGHLSQFRCAYAQIISADDHIVIDPEAAAILDVSDGDQVTYIAR